MFTLSFKPIAKAIVAYSSLRHLQLSLIRDLSPSLQCVYICQLSCLLTIGESASRRHTEYLVDLCWSDVVVGNLILKTQICLTHICMYTLNGIVYSLGGLLLQYLCFSSTGVADAQNKNLSMKNAKERIADCFGWRESHRMMLLTFLCLKNPARYSSNAKSVGVRGGII